VHAAKEEAENVELAGTRRNSKRSKVGRHCRRWWWVHLIVFLIFALVIIIIIIYGVIPPVAQKDIDDTRLQLNSLDIENPTESSFVVSLSSTIKGLSGVAQNSHLDPFDIRFFLDGTDPDTQTFLTLPVDRINGGSSIPVVKNDVEVQVQNSPALAAFSSALLGQETLRVALRGRATVWLGKIHTGVNYNEVVTMKGLNNLAGMKITNYTLAAGAGQNIAGSVLIPNPSVVTVQMGNVNLQISLAGTALGTGLIPNLTLTPGNNEYPFNALISEDQLFPLAAAVAAKQSVSITSNGTTAGSSNTPISWLSAPLKGLNATVPFDVPTSSS